MKHVLDAWWRALAYCFMPRIVWLSLLPLVLCAVVTGLLGYYGWEPAVAQVNAVLSGSSLAQTVFGWFEWLGFGRARGLMAPLIVVALALPLVVLACLIAVTSWLTPLVAEIVRRRRFPGLATRADEPWAVGLARSLGLSLLALVVLILSLPLWLIPPLAALIPPLIWGWLTYRVMTSDTLSVAASREETRQLAATHRWPLLMLGVVTGYMGALPAAIWVFGAATLVFAPLLLVASVWLYMLVFTFSSLWFAHYLLDALHRLRQASAAPPVAPLQPLPAA